MKKVFNSQKIIDNLCEQYREGKSTYELARIFGCNRTTISDELKRNNIKMRSKSERDIHLGVNEYYFSDIDNEKKAYFLGLIYADGCIKPKSNIVSLCLKKEDSYLLEELKKDMSLGRKIYNHNHKNGKIYCYLSACHHKLVDDLKSIGCSERKTFTCDLPTLDGKIMRHFIRGYFDGDGCVTHKKYKESKYASVQICCSELFAKNLKKYLIENINIKSSISTSKSIHCVKMSNNQAIKFLSWIYEESNICMKRKFNKFKDLQEEDIRRKNEKRY